MHFKQRCFLFVFLFFSFRGQSHHFQSSTLAEAEPGDRTALTLLATLLLSILF